MKKFLSFILAVASAATLTFSVNAADFTDTVDHKNAEAIEVLSTLEIVNGYEDGTFGPDKELTRAELCAMLVRAIYDKAEYSLETTFEDVPVTHWARKYIDTAYNNKIMRGYNDTTFAPDEKLTYTQAARTILNVLGYSNTIAWPDGVNLVSLELGLYDEIAVADYSAPCTRAHAAQMIYNAFGLEVKKDVVGIPLSTGKYFLTDLLGFVETSVYENGHEYVAYEDANGELYVTDIVLTYELPIISAKRGEAYRLEKNGERFTIDYDTIEFYVNDVEVPADKTIFSDNEETYGIFNTDDELIGIRVITKGETFVAALGTEDVPADILEDIEEDDYYDVEFSTVTYFPESGKYEISNTVATGFVTLVRNSYVIVDGMHIDLEDARTYCDIDDYIVIHYDVNGVIAAVRVIEDPYYYDLEELVYHTWNCKEIHKDCYNSIEDMIADYVANGGNKERLRFNDCDECNTIGRINIYVNDYIEEPEVECYIYEGGKHIHVAGCSALEGKTAVKTTVTEAVALGKINECGECADKFN